MFVQAQPLATIDEKIFRAYDIRGIADKNLTPEVMHRIARAFATLALERQQYTVIVGCDGRISSPALADALIAGLAESGIDVIDLGQVPTPVLFFATHVLESKTGLMITGSHNPAHYNGLKMVLDGETLATGAIQNLYQRVVDGIGYSGRGTISHLNLLPKYLDAVIESVKLSRPLKVVVDCAHGIAAKIAPAMLKRLGCEVSELNCTVDGNFPAHEPDTGIPENYQQLIAAVKDVQADLGIMFDGDADRLGIITRTGEIIWPDRLMLLYVADILAREQSRPIVYDVKCSRHLAATIRQLGGTPVMCQTGHSLIKAKMKEINAVLAGEMSGHIFFNDRWFGFDDGLYSAARLLEIVSRLGLECLTELPNSVHTPELKVAMAENLKFQFMEQFIANADFSDAEMTTIDGLRVDFTKGWGLLRPSNTSPYLILRFEADDAPTLEAIKLRFKKQMLAIEPTLTVPF